MGNAGVKDGSTLHILPKWDLFNSDLKLRIMAAEGSEHMEAFVDIGASGLHRDDTALAMVSVPSAMQDLPGKIEIGFTSMIALNKILLGMSANTPHFSLGSAHRSAFSACLPAVAALCASRNSFYVDMPGDWMAKTRDCCVSASAGKHKICNAYRKNREAELGAFVSQLRQLSVMLWCNARAIVCKPGSDTEVWGSSVVHSGFPQSATFFLHLDSSGEYRLVYPHVQVAGTAVVAPYLTDDRWCTIYRGTEKDWAATSRMSRSDWVSRERNSVEADCRGAHEKIFTIFHRNMHRSDVKHGDLDGFTTLAAISHSEPGGEDEDRIIRDASLFNSDNQMLHAVTYASRPGAPTLTLPALEDAETVGEHAAMEYLRLNGSQTLSREDRQKYQRSRHVATDPESETGISNVDRGTSLSFADMYDEHDMLARGGDLDPMGHEGSMHSATMVADEIRRRLMPHLALHDPKKHEASMPVLVLDGLKKEDDLHISADPSVAASEWKSFHSRNALPAFVSFSARPTELSILVGGKSDTNRSERRDAHRAVHAILPGLVEEAHQRSAGLSSSITSELEETVHEDLSAEITGYLAGAPLASSEMLHQLLTHMYSVGNTIDFKSATNLWHIAPHVAALPPVMDVESGLDHMRLIAAITSHLESVPSSFARQVLPAAVLDRLPSDRDTDESMEDSDKAVKDAYRTLAEHGYIVPPFHAFTAALASFMDAPVATLDMTVHTEKTVPMTEKAGAWDMPSLLDRVSEIQMRYHVYVPHLDKASSYSETLATWHHRVFLLVRTCDSMGELRYYVSRSPVRWEPRPRLPEEK